MLCELMGCRVRKGAAFSFFLSATNNEPTHAAKRVPVVKPGMSEFTPARPVPAYMPCFRRREKGKIAVRGVRAVSGRRPRWCAAAARGKRAKAAGCKMLRCARWQGRKDARYVKWK